MRPLDEPVAAWTAAHPLAQCREAAEIGRLT